MFFSAEATEQPFSAADVALRLGISVDRFYRIEAKLIAEQQMPASTKPGKRAYDRAAMEAWLTRNDPRRPKAAANDPLPPPMPRSDGEWNDFLRRHYATP